MAAPVVLHMDVHCSRCAKKIRKCLRNMHGVYRVWTSVQTRTVVVAGTADASMVRWRIENKMGRPVTIISDGRPPHFEGIRHLAPPHYSSYAPAPPPHPYAYAYGNHWTPPPQYQCQYGGTPSIFDDTVPAASFCSIM